MNELPLLTDKVLTNRRKIFKLLLPIKLKCNPDDYSYTLDYNFTNPYVNSHTLDIPAITSDIGSHNALNYFNNVLPDTPYYKKILELPTEHLDKFQFPYDALTPNLAKSLLLRLLTGSLYDFCTIIASHKFSEMTPKKATVLLEKLNTDNSEHKFTIQLCKDVINGSINNYIDIIKKIENIDITDSDSSERIDSKILNFILEYITSNKTKYSGLKDYDDIDTKKDISKITYGDIMHKDVYLIDSVYTNDALFLTGISPKIIDINYISKYFLKAGTVIKNFNINPVKEIYGFIELLEQEDLQMFASVLGAYYIDEKFFDKIHNNYLALPVDILKNIKKLKESKKVSGNDFKDEIEKHMNTLNSYLYFNPILTTSSPGMLYNKDFKKMDNLTKYSELIGNFVISSSGEYNIDEHMACNYAKNDTSVIYRYRAIIFSFILMLKIYDKLKTIIPVPFLDAYYKHRNSNELLKLVHKDYIEGKFKGIFKLNGKHFYLALEKYYKNNIQLDNKILFDKMISKENIVEAFNLDKIFNGFYTGIVVSSRIKYVTHLSKITRMLKTISNNSNPEDMNIATLEELFEGIDGLDEIDITMDFSEASYSRKESLLKKLLNVDTDDMLSKYDTLNMKNAKDRKEDKYDVNVDVDEDNDSKWDYNVEYLTNNKSIEKNKAFLDSYHSAIKGIDPIINKLIIELEKIRVYNETQKMGGLPKGRLDSKNLYKYKNDKNIFKDTKHKQLESDLAIGILLDVSGSMHGQKIKDGVLTTILLHETLNSMNVNHAIYTHTSDGTNQADIKCYRTFNEHDNYDKSKVYRLLSIDAEYGNCDAAAVDYVSKHLNNTRNRDKILLVFSDGEPTECSNKELKESIKNASKNAKVIGIGIKMPNIRKYYDTYANGNNLSDLTDIVSNIIKDYVLEKET